jgi:3-hydroxyisobutyrate dehydrogenase
MRIAFVGLGAMGVPMAINLVKAGHAVSGFDVRAGAAEPLAAAGGRAAASAAEAARDAELLWLMVVSGEQAQAVLFDHGAATALPEGAIVVAACTQPPALARKTADRLAALRIEMLDAPVSGGVAGANAAALTIMASGSETTLACARPALEAVGKRIFDVGREAGMGSTAKMINQLLCGVHIAAAAEAMHVAERAGVSKATMHEIISVSAGNSWMWGDRGPRMMTDEPPVTSAVDIFVKDLGIVLDQGRQMRQGLPLAAAAMQMFLAASGLGHGAADDSQVIRAYRALNGTGGTSPGAGTPATMAGAAPASRAE